jgi:hypothetical protein
MILILTGKLMLIYEVNLTINASVYEEFMSWLKPHIKDMLAFEGFEKAEVLFERNATDPSAKKVTVHYHINSYDNYLNYINEKATGMRSQTKALFKDQFSINRRVLEREPS